MGMEKEKLKAIKSAAMNRNMTVYEPAGTAKIR